MIKTGVRVNVNKKCSVLGQILSRGKLFVG